MKITPRKKLTDTGKDSKSVQRTLTDTGENVKK